MKRLISFFTLAGITLAFSGIAAAKTCELSISGNDQMQYNKSELKVSGDCDKVKLTLQHSGSMDVGQMGHNWVLSKTADFEAVARDGQQTGRGSDYVPRNDDRVLAHTELIGGGDSTSVTFDTAKLESGGDYTFFCSFPGHFVSMQGKLIVA